jgi:hypothetical protein
VGMGIERAVQLIDRRAAEPAVEDGERPAHCLPPDFQFISVSLQQPTRECKSKATFRPGRLAGSGLPPAARKPFPAAQRSRPGPTS